MSEEISQIEMEIFNLNQKLQTLKAAHRGDEVPDYTFSTQNGETTLLECFGGHDRLLVIHNMGQGCRYCTLWAELVLANDSPHFVVAGFFELLFLKRCRAG